MSRILGVSAFYHDSAACLLQDGNIVAAVQEERFSRIKHDSSFPARAIAACLKIGECRVSDLDYVVFYEKPFIKFERLLMSYLRRCPHGIRSYLKAIPVWMKEKLWIKEILRRELDYQGEILFAEHHESHAASAFYPSPFQQAAILTVDGVGEWTTAAYGWGSENELQLISEICFPDSLGLLYSTFTYYLGFEVNSGEYKLMGLAPYGSPIFVDTIKKELIEIYEDGSFKLNPRYFNFETGLTMASDAFAELFGGPARNPFDPLTRKHQDLAASVQRVTEEVLLKAVRHLLREVPHKNLCLAGGVALNSVANGRILNEAGIEQLWIQPAAGDAGGALGCALLIWHRFQGRPRDRAPGREDGQQGSLLGTSYTREQVREFLKSQRAPFHELDTAALIQRTAAALAEGRIAGWFQGRMEFGPRALGSRSILADPRCADMQDRINRRVKFRESFRPFAPVILEERSAEYFSLDRPSPYMLLVQRVAPAKLHLIPAVTHVDGSARIQTVNQRQNERLYSLIQEFDRRTNVPLLVNTSFNIKGEPIVESPEQAFQCFMRTDMDILVIGNVFLDKKEQPTGLKLIW
ncbi:MAG: carbamoyltransferase [Acidobacteria bacterium]|nr:carbamoyltransferase [Acidobacteriota bacterium]